MAITVKHTKVSAIPDAGDTTLVQPSDWNADHTLTGTIPVANGGTGASTANSGFNALAPSQTGNSGKYLTTDGTDTSWSTNPLGTVTSVATGTGLTGGPITTSGTISIDSTVATLTGTQTLTNKTLTSPIVNEILDTNGNEVLGLLSTASATDYVGIKNGIGVGVPLHISAEGSSANIGLHIQPKGTGLVTISDGTDFNKGIRFRSSGSAASAITLLDAVSTAGHVITLPDATTVLVGRGTTDTLTNKSISGSTNTLSNIGNASLTNSAITINGTSTSLGGSISVGTVTSVTGTAPIASSGGATPAISISQSNTTTDGYLSSTDWNTFNGKSNTNGTVTSVAALTLGTTGTDLSSTVATGTTTPVITLQVPTASATNRGALSAADWTTFNSKGSGTVTSVGGTGSINGLTLTGTVTSSGDLTLGGSITSVSTSGNFQMNSLGVGTAGSTTAGEIRATNNVTAYYSSDRTLKENIANIDNALDIVCSIGSKSFDWTEKYIESKGGVDGYFVQKSDFGVIAQDVQAVFPQAVRTRKDGTLAVDYEKLGTLAFGAISQLLKRVEALESK